MDERIRKISERWFLLEPALFSIYCSHQLVENYNMDCPMRCGQGKVEYNPKLANDYSDIQLEESLRTEMIRLFLKHPYERQPENSLPEALSFGSDMVIGQHYNFKTLHLMSADNFQLPVGQYFEWYVVRLNEILRNIQGNPQESDDSEEKNDSRKENQDDEESNNGDGNSDDGNNDSQNSAGDQNNGNADNEDSDSSEKQNGQSNNTDGEGSADDNAQNEFGSGIGDNNQNMPGFSLEEIQSARDKSALWEEDDLKQQEINEIIASTTNWGSLSRNLVEKIKASMIVKLDYRKVLSSFHTSILSSRRHLTRMRPNRRSGFEQMGSIYELASKLLIAIDVSGSVTSKTLSAFYSVISRFFKYGIETIDTIQFDTELKELKSLKKAQKEIEISGRGGTNFQPIFDYISEHKHYDGLIIFTDGYAPQPIIKSHLRTKILWICQSESEYKEHKNWMKQSGKVCWIEF